MRQGWRRWPLPALLLVLGGCAPGVLRSLVPDDGTVTDVYLIGDAGKPDRLGDPVLIAAQRTIEKHGQDHALVVFLGDNIYPDGMPDEDAPARTEAERILRAQMEVPLGAGAQGIFVTGNHGWDHSGPEGWERILHQQEFIRKNGQGRVTLLPGGGCPGPEVRDVGDHLRLLVLDTQWWLHPYQKPLPPESRCPTQTEQQVVDAIRQALREAGTRKVIVMAHHPLVSGGTHGVWPLLPTRFAPKPAFDPQDLGHPRYRRMRSMLQAALAEHPPLIYAAGHDHNLQVLRGVGARYALVSGSGVYGHTGPVRRLPRTLYAKRASGFMRLSIRPDGQVRLGVYVVDARGNATEDFSILLD